MKVFQSEEMELSKVEYINRKVLISESLIKHKALQTLKNVDGCRNSDKDTM